MVVTELMPEHATTENKSILSKMKTRLEFLKNPRFQQPSLAALPSGPVAGTLTLKKGAHAGQTVERTIVAEPAVTNSLIVFFFLSLFCLFLLC